MWTLLISIAIATTAPTIGASAHPSNAPAVLLEQAQERILRGDYEGTKLLAEQALAQDGDHQLEAQLFVGMSYEFAGEEKTALKLYNRLRRQADRDDIALFVRRSETLLALGRPARAKRALRKAKPYDTLTPVAQTRVAVDLGLIDLHRNRNKQGFEKLRAVVEEAEEGVATADRARAYNALIRRTIEISEDLSLTGKNAGTRMITRAQLVHQARVWTLQMIPMNEPEFIVEGLSWLGQGYESFGDEILSVGHPGAHQRAEAVYLKAQGIYRRGVEQGIKTGWQGDAYQRVLDQKATIDQKIASLPL